MRIDNKLGMDVVSALVYNRLMYAREYDFVSFNRVFQGIA
jgi:hypothetical protein